MEKLTTIYYYVALFATILFIAKTLIFSVFGGDAEVHADFTSSVETETSFDFLSIQSILAFLMGLGWMGLTCIKVWALPKIYVLLIPVLFGLLLMCLSSYLMFCVKKLNKHVKKDMTKAIGTTAKAYTNFNGNSEGQIEISINNQLSIENAINAGSDPIKAFDEVKVIKFENNKLYIEKI